MGVMDRAAPSDGNSRRRVADALKGVVWWPRQKLTPPDAVGPDFRMRVESRK